MFKFFRKTMIKRIIQFSEAPARNPFLFILPAVIALACAGCGLIPAAVTAAPQSGKWEADFSFENENAVACHWTIIFFVDEGGKKITDIQTEHYYGELTPDTQVSFVDYPNETAIVKNSFEFSVTEWQGYSSSTYEGKVTFASAAEAKGALNIDGAEYDWTASPVAD